MHEDHEHARAFAGIVGGARGACVVPPETNIVMVDLPPGVSALDLVRRAAEQEVLITPWSATRVRRSTC